MDVGAVQHREARLMAREGQEQVGAAQQDRLRSACRQPPAGGEEGLPLLVVDGHILSESTAIQVWIARHFPQARLLPADPWQELKAIALHSWCSSGIHPFLARINSPPRVSDAPNSDESVRRLAKEQLSENFKIADDLLAGREFFFDHFTAPDAHFFWCCRRATQFELDLSGFQNCTAHFERMTKRPSVQKLLAFEKSVQEDFAKAA